MKLIREAAERGNPDVQETLGLMYYYGRVVKKNPKKAAFWIKKAADQGKVTAQYSMGILYQQGEGVKKNNVKAVYYFRQAVEQNHIEAKRKLANMIRYGRGVKRDAMLAANMYHEINYPSNTSTQSAVKYSDTLSVIEASNKKVAKTTAKESFSQTGNNELVAGASENLLASHYDYGEFRELTKVEKKLKKEEEDREYYKESHQKEIDKLRSKIHDENDDDKRLVYEKELKTSEKSYRKTWDENPDPPSRQRCVIL